MTSVLIIFDFDGTLVELEDMQNAAYDYVLSKRNIDYDMRTVPPGVPITQKIKMLNELGYVIDDPDEFRDERDQWVVDNVHKYLKHSPELERVISKLSENYIMCIATNAGLRYVERACDILKINQYITKINSSDYFDAKPAPDMILDLIETYGMAVVYEDSESGFEAARRANAFCVHVSGQADLISKLKLHYDI